MKVFISGSRSIKSLSEGTQKVLQSIIDKNDEVLIGDCDGVDDLVQQYFKDRRYTNVTVYVAGSGRARYNAGFKEKHITVDKSIPHATREFYAIKDIAMSYDCDYGIAIWDGKSRGTLSNIHRMGNLDKNMDVINYMTASSGSPLRYGIGSCDFGSFNILNRICKDRCRAVLAKCDFHMNRIFLPFDNRCRLRTVGICQIIL